MNPFPTLFHFSFCLLVLSHFLEGSNVESIENHIITFCFSNYKEDCLEEIRANAHLLEGSIWAKLVSCDFKPESEPQLQAFIESALNGDVSRLNVLHKLNSIQYIYEPASLTALKSFFKNSDGLPLRLSSSQRTLGLLRDFLDNLPEEMRDYDFEHLVSPFRNPKFNQVLLALRKTPTFTCSLPFTSIVVEEDDEIDFIVDEMLLLKPFKVRNFLKIFTLKVNSSSLEQANIDWNSVAMKKEVLRTLWINRYMHTSSKYLDALTLPFYQKIEKLKLRLFGPSTVWSYLFRNIVPKMENIELLETKFALAPAPAEWNLHAKLGLYFGISRFLVNIRTTAAEGASVPYSFEKFPYFATSAHYEPLEQAYKKLFLDNPAEQGNRVTWQKIYNATFKVGNDFRRNGRFGVLSQLNLYDPLMIEIYHKDHLGSIVIRGSRLWFCDRSKNGIEVFEMKAEENRLNVVKKFLYEVFIISTNDLQLFDKVQRLISQVYRKVEIIPLGMQYTGNCTLQGWILGLRCAFLSMSVQLEKFQLLTSTARGIVWGEAIKALPLEESYKIPMLMAHIMAKEGDYSISGLIDMTSELLLEVRSAFFYPSSHLHTYKMSSDFAEEVRLKLEGKGLALAKMKTNGDVILEMILANGNGYHPYLRILAMCLLRQGEGVATFLKTLIGQQELLEEIRSYSLCMDFTFLHAIVYSANRFQKEIRSAEFEAVWELSFGQDWQDFIPGMFTQLKPLPAIALEKVPSGKALFYATLLIMYCVDQEQSFSELSAKFDQTMINQCPQLKYFDDAIRRNGNEPSSINFPYLLYFSKCSNLILSHN